MNCPGATCSLGHRECEPVWDLNYIGKIDKENDLMHVKLEVEPNSVKRDIVLKLNNGAANIRIWPAATKGAKGTIITIDPVNPPKYKISTLPKNYYVEGINIGSAEFEAEIELVPNYKKSKKLTTHVVSLIEGIKSGANRTRHVIYPNATGIEFKVEGGDAFNGKYLWEETQKVNPPASPLPTVSLSGANHVLSISYGASGCTITVPEDADHRRYTSIVTTKITDGKSPPTTILELKRNARVAQATFQGTAVASILTPPTPPPANFDPHSARRTEVQRLATPPAGFSNTETPDDALTMFSETWFKNTYTGTGAPTINSTRLQYAPNATGVNTGGLTVFYPGMGASRKVYALFIFPAAYNARFRKEDLRSIVEHECRHVKHVIEVKSPTSDWRILDDHYGGPNGHVLFAEADSECVEITLMSGGSWRYLETQSAFYRTYTGAMQRYDILKSGNPSATSPEPPASPAVQKAAKNILEAVS